VKGENPPRTDVSNGPTARAVIGSNGSGIIDEELVTIGIVDCDAVLSDVSSEALDNESVPSDSHLSRTVVRKSWKADCKNGPRSSCSGLAIIGSVGRSPDIISGPSFSANARMSWSSFDSRLSRYGEFGLGDNGKSIW
jgi:hypothetical protein